MNLPLTLSLRPSVSLAAVLLFIHALAAAGVAPADLPMTVKLVLWLAIAGSAFHGIRFHALRYGRRAVIGLTLRSDGKLEIERRDGECIELQVDGGSTVFPKLVVLLLKSGAKRLALTLPEDALGAQAHRQLRLWLRWRINLVSAA